MENKALKVDGIFFLSGHLYFAPIECIGSECCPASLWPTRDATDLYDIAQVMTNF